MAIEAPQILILGYHLTPRENLNKIIAEGLSPRVPTDMEGEPRAVFLFTDLTAVEEGFENWYYDRFPEDTEFVLLTVDITGIATIEGAEFEHVVPTHIPADRIIAMRDYN